MAVQKVWNFGVQFLSDRLTDFDEIFWAQSSPWVLFRIWTSTAWWQVAPPWWWKTKLAKLPIAKSFWFEFLQNGIVNILEIWTVVSPHQDQRLQRNSLRNVNRRPGGAPRSVKLSRGISPRPHDRSWRNFMVVVSDCRRLRTRKVWRSSIAYSVDRTLLPPMPGVRITKTFFFEFLRNVIVNVLRIWNVGVAGRDGRLAKNSSRNVNRPPGGAAKSVKLSRAISPGPSDRSRRNFEGGTVREMALWISEDDGVATGGAALSTKNEFLRTKTGELTWRVPLDGFRRGFDRGVQGKQNFRVGGSNSGSTMPICQDLHPKLTEKKFCTFLYVFCNLRRNR